MKEEKPKGKAPVLKLRAGKFQASVFENESKNNLPAYDSVSINKSFTKDDGKTWEQQNISVYLNEIADLMLVCQAVLNERKIIKSE